MSRFAIASVLLAMTLATPVLAEGQLTLTASGEDRAVEGFTSRDGWTLSFERITVGLADIVAYQTDPPFDALGEGELVAIAEVGTADIFTVNLAAAEVVPVTTLTAPAGRYNALAFSLESPVAERGSMILAGTADRDGESIDFEFEIMASVRFTCGDYVGDARKGFLDAGGEADLEMTFHLDHLFGDASKPEDDLLNQISLGFDPIASLAVDGVAQVTSDDIGAALGPEGFFAFLENVVAELGHVGEGHCRAEFI